MTVSGADFNTYDGQANSGRVQPVTDSPREVNKNVLILGIGQCDLKEDKVNEPCTWSVTQEDFLIRFSTHHLFWRAQPYRRAQSLAFRKDDPLSNNRLQLRKHVNPDSMVSAPFFPQPETVELCRFNAPVFLPDNEGYGFARSGFICRRSKTWNRDYYQAVNHEAHSNLYVLQRHPKLGLVAGACSYIPTFLPIWGNERTFSWEPYMECTIAVGQEKHWHIDYIF